MCYGDITHSYGHIYLEYGYIKFIQIPEEVIDYVIQFTNCNLYVIFVNNEITKYHGTMSHHNIWILPEINNNDLYYNVFVNDNFVLQLKRNHTLKLIWTHGVSIDTVKKIFQLINEIIEYSPGVQGEYKILFNKEEKWIPGEDVFKPQFLD